MNRIWLPLAAGVAAVGFAAPGTAAPSATAPHYVAQHEMVAGDVNAMISVISSYGDEIDG